MLLSDIHIGSPQCDYATFLRHADLLAKHDNLYAIVLGDVVEWAISQRMMSSVLEQVMPPAVQARFWKAFVSDLLKKLVAVVMGNHEGRSERYGGFDVGEYLYHELTNGAAPYLKDGGSLRILVGEQEYSGLLMHGDGIPGNSMYSKTAKHQRLQRHQWGWHDFACIGHTHEAEVLVTEVPTDDAGGRREVHQLQAGSYKVLHSEQYPHRMGFMGSPIVDMPAIVLWPDQKRMASFRRVESALAALEGWK
jgi:predicted phosphodiesterase